MDRQMLDALEEQEREDQVMEAGSWYDLVMKDFANGREVVPIMEEMLQRQAPKLRYLRSSTGPCVSGARWWTGERRCAPAEHFPCASTPPVLWPIFTAMTSMK